MMEFQKSKQEILQKTLCLTTLIPESNTNQEEPIIHFTNTLITITNKTIPKTTTRECLKLSNLPSQPTEILKIDTKNI